jgi:hypothetical protein
MEDELVIEEIVPPNVDDLDNVQISNVNVDGVAATTIVFVVPPPASAFTKGKVESGIKTEKLLLQPSK